ncbi:hypothetical protein BHE74_00037209, partial [Ensete ventricosum]
IDHWSYFMLMTCLSFLFKRRNTSRQQAITNFGGVCDSIKISITAFFFYFFCVLLQSIWRGSYMLQAWALYERGEVLSIVDTSLGDDCDAEEACKFIKIALLCTQDAPKLRPSMPAVVRMLRGESNVSMEITKPGLITDLMDLKVRRQRDAGEPDASPVVFTTLHGSPSSSSGNATPNMSSSSTAAELA